MPPRENEVEVFVSYAMVDSARLNIVEIAERLSKKHKIRVHYWQGWDGYPDGNIIDFMEKNIRNSSVFIPICTQAMVESDNCKKERDMAIYQNKKTIPVFEQFEFVPDIFQPYKGINISKKDVAQIIEELYDLILTMMKISIEEESLAAPNRTMVKKRYRGKMIREYQIEILKKIQTEAGQVFKSYEVNEEGFVISLDLSSKRMNRIPASISELSQLQKINFSSNSFSQDEEIREVVFDGINVTIDGKEYEDGQIGNRVNQPLIAKYGVKLEQAIALRDLEELLGTKIRQFSTQARKLGYKVENQDVIELVICKKQLKMLPESFSNFKALRILNLSENNFTTVPESLSGLDSLKKLDLNFSKIESIPESFGNLPLLVILELPGNKLKKLPESIGKLRSLRHLYLGSNRLREIPSSFEHLQNLQTLYLTHNEIRDFPTEILKLRSLSVLDINHNNLTELPKSIGELSSLQELAIGENQLTALPSSIGNLRALKSLKVGTNPITDLPNSLLNLPNLEYFAIYDCPLSKAAENLIKELAKKNPQLGLFLGMNFKFQ